jgi:hypothetical protein
MNIPKFTIIRYLRDKKRVPYGVLVATKNDGGYNIGYSLCNKYDRFEKKMALKIALGRADYNGSSIANGESLPYAVSKAMPDFLERCKKYYKN